MEKLFKNNCGATAVEFAILALPVFVFILGIMHFAYIVWTDNLLHISVDTAARCGAIQSTTPPCQGSGTTQMESTANAVFFVKGGTLAFINNSSCSADGGAGLIGTYQIKFLFAVTLTLTAKSCYPVV
jgi:Flp pilus assembly protein TadG